MRGLALAGAVEQMHVERIVTAGWRLRRPVLVENQVLDLADQPRRLKAFLVGPAVISLANPVRPRPPEHRVGAAFATSTTGVLDRLARYEVTHERSLHRNLHELERLQARRAGIPVLPPIAIDVDVTGGDFESQNPGSHGAEPEDSRDLVEEFRNGFASMIR